MLEFFTHGVSAKEFNFIATMNDSVDGTGAETNLELNDYWSAKQIKWLKIIYEKANKK